MCCRGVLIPAYELQLTSPKILLSMSRLSSFDLAVNLHFNTSQLSDVLFQVFMDLSFDDNIEKSSTTTKMAEKANVKKSKREQKKDKKEKKRELAKQLRKEVSVEEPVNSLLEFPIGEPVGLTLKSRLMSICSGFA